MPAPPNLSARASGLLKRLEMRLRVAAPRPLRAAYRLARSARAIAAHVAPPRLPADLVDGCMVVADRVRLLERMPQGGVLAELGTLEGRYAAAILRICHPKRLEIVDIDLSRLDPKVAGDPRVRCTQGLTADVIAGFPEEHFDMIYVDADHSYAGVKADARACAAKLKPGGYLVFNDYAHIDPWLGRYGVCRAVNEFAVEQRWPMRFLALDANGLYDVALQKPDP